MFQAIAVGYAIMVTRSLDLDWKMRALRVLPMFLLPALSSIIYLTLRGFTRMCKLFIALFVCASKFVSLNLLLVMHIERIMTLLYS